MKKTIWIIKFILLCIWQFPQLLVGVIMWFFMGDIKIIACRHFNFCFEGENMSGGISLGPICYVSKHSSKSKEAIAHELDGHTMDSKIFGPLYLFVIGIPSLLWAGFYDPTKRCYYSFYTERWANKHAHLKVNDRCLLEFEK